MVCYFQNNFNPLWFLNLRVCLQKQVVFFLTLLKSLMTRGNNLDGRSAKGPFIYYVSLFLGIFDPSPFCLFSVLKISKNCPFLTPLSPVKCLRNIWIVPENKMPHTHAIFLKLKTRRQKFIILFLESCTLTPFCKDVKSWQKNLTKLCRKFDESSFLESSFLLNLCQKRWKQLNNGWANSNRLSISVLFYIPAKSGLWFWTSFGL